MHDIQQKIASYLQTNGPKAKIRAVRKLSPLKKALWLYCLLAVPGYFIAMQMTGSSSVGVALVLALITLTILAIIVLPVVALAPIGITSIVVRIGLIIFGLSFPNSLLRHGDYEALKPVSFLLDGIVYIGVIWLLYRLYLEWKRDPEAVKEKPDHLGGDAATCVAEKLNDTDGVWAGRAGENDLFASIEDRAVVLGPPGAGKTAFLVTQLLKWADTKRPFICLDTKPEIFGITRDALAKRGYRTIVYNPTAGRGQRYNPINDLTGPEAIGELAAALIPSEDPADAVFNESARDLLDALISHLQATEQNASLPAIRALINSCGSYQDLLRLLANSPDHDVVDIVQNFAMTAANERLIGSIFGTLRANLRFLRYPNIRASLEASDFSLADVSGDQPVALFLQFEEHQRETTAHLLSAMVAHIMRYLITHTARPPVLLFLDEIGTVPPIPGFIAKLNTIRSRNLPTWTYWQSLEQMQRYGAKADEGANLILGACDMQMVFRLNDNASAQWMSERIGVIDVTVRAESIGPGLLRAKSESTSLVTEAKVFPHELQQLSDGQVVCTYRDLAWKGEATPYFQIWQDYQGKRPKGEQLFGKPFPEQEDAA